MSTFYHSKCVSFKDNAKFEFLICFKQADLCQRVLVSMVRRSSATVAKLDVEEQCYCPGRLLSTWTARKSDPQRWEEMGRDVFSQIKCKVET